MEESMIGQNQKKEGISEGERLARIASELWSEIESKTLESRSQIDLAFNIPESQDPKNAKIANILSAKKVKDGKTPVQVEYNRLLNQGSGDAEITKNMQEIIEYLKRIKTLQA